MPVRVLLDTCVVRSYVHTVGPKLDIEGIVAHASELRVSLADSCFAELMAQLLERRCNFSDWSSKVHELDSILDKAFPIFPGGNELAYMSGIWQPAPINLSDSAIYYCACWDYMSSAKCIDDLTNEVTFTDSEGTHRICGNENQVKMTLEGHRNRWRDYVHDMQKRLAGKKPEEVWSLIRMGLSPKDGEPADFAARLDCVAKCLALFLNMALKKNGPYNPDGENRAGDVFDMDLLYALPLPAIIVTADEKFYNRMRSLDCQQVSQIVLVEEFNQHIHNGTLASLIH